MDGHTKEKLLYILEFLKKTDEQHPVNTNDILQYLNKKGIPAERKSIARDIAVLRNAGYSIILCDELKKGYYMTDQLFEDYELKMIADAVCGAKFLPYKDSVTLMGKICALATATGEELIKEQSFIDENIKSKNRTVRFTIDKIINAIKQNCRITFHYLEIQPDGSTRLKRDGHTYDISPYYLCWLEDSYFLIGNSKSHNHLTHYHVEMMVDVELTKEPIRQKSEIEEFSGDFSIGEYLRRNINMYTGEIIPVTLECSQKIAKDFRARFGEETPITPIGEDRFRADIMASEGEGLLRWLSQFSADDLVVLEPEEIRKELQKRAQAIAKNYK